MANKVSSSKCVQHSCYSSDTSIPCMKRKYNYKKIMKGKRWEYPLPCMRNYWKKIISEERRKLLAVRNPFLQLSYNSFPKKYCDSIDCNTFVENQSFNRNFFPNSYLDDRDTSDNSLHKLHLMKANVKSNRNCFDNVKSILKRSHQTVPKSLDTMYYSTTSFEGVRIPKLNTRGPQPSSGRIHPGKVDHIRASFNVQNERKIQENNSTTLPILTKYPGMSELQSRLKKLRKYLKLSKETDLKTKDQALYDNDKTIKEIRKKLSTDRSTMKRIKENLLPNEDSLKYTARSAYKALKCLSKDRNIDFKLKSVDHLKQGSFLKSSENFLVSNDDNQVSVKSKRIEKDKLKEESSHICEMPTIFEQKSLEGSEFSGIDDENGTLKSDETMSRSISTESRYTSGPSPEPVLSERSEDNPATRILSSIPKLSFPRKNRDRCLPCMYKSFETSPERKISLPRTVLQRIIDDEKLKATSLKDSFEASDSTSTCSIPSLRNEIERILNDEVETRNVGFDDVESNVPESEVTEDAVSSFQEKGIQKRPEDAAEQKSIAEPETSRNEITKKGKGDPQHDEAASTNLNEEARIETNRTQVGSPGQTKEGPSSLHSEESTEEEEDDSIAVSTIGDDDQPKSKYLVPCHAPTNFRPSLEPLRALRNRKPTTLQHRIDLLETSSLRKSGSMDEQEKSRPKSVLEKERSSDEAKPVPPRPLTKAKSVLEKLTPEKAETIVEMRQHVLRKGTSFSGFPVSTPTSNKSEIYRDDASKGTLRELDETRDDGLLKTPLATDLSRAGTKLPLTRPHEIVEILTNLEENASSTDMLNILCKEFSERLSKNSENNDPITRERNRMITNLTRLLIDSKRYLYPDKFPSHLLFSTHQPPIHNMKVMRQILPITIYNKTARLLNLPKWHIKQEDLEEKDVEEEEEKVEIESFDSLEVNPPTLKDDEPPDEEKPPLERRYNPYALFLIKPRRKVITWRPLKKEDLEGYDPEATLKMRADNSMKRICQDFCQWVESLGGTDNTIDEEVLRDMFEIDFSADICRTLQVKEKYR